MKKILFVLMSVLWIGAAVSMPVRAEEALQQEEAELCQIMLTNEAVEAKEIPDDSAATVISYESGAPVFVIGETTDGWYKVSYQDKAGYVHKTSLVMSELDVEGIDKEMEAAEAESRLIVEEVERYRAEARRSRIWGTVIVLLVVGIFATGIISTVKNERKKKEEEAAETAEETAAADMDDNIIDLDKEE